MLTVERGPADDDRTVVRPAIEPAIVSAQPGTDGRPLGQRSVLLPLFLLGGFLVLLMRSDARFSDDAEFVLRGFVLPLVGLVLSQWPSGSASGPTPALHGAPFPPQQTSPGPPFGTAS